MYADVVEVWWKMEERWLGGMGQFGILALGRNFGLNCLAISIQGDLSLGVNWSKVVSSSVYRLVVLVDGHSHYKTKQCKVLWEALGEYRRCVKRKALPNEEIEVL